MFLRTDWTQACVDDTGNCLRTFAVSSQVCLIGASYHCWLDTRGRRRVTQKISHPHHPRQSCPFCSPTLSRVRFVTPLHHFCRGIQFFSRKNKKVEGSNFFFNFQCLHTVTGGAMGAHSIRESGLCLCVCWLISKSPYQQLVDDKELIVDKVVLINKHPYNSLPGLDLQKQNVHCVEFPDQCCIPTEKRRCFTIDKWVKSLKTRVFWRLLGCVWDWNTYR